MAGGTGPGADPLPDVFRAAGQQAFSGGHLYPHPGGAGLPAGTGHLPRDLWPLPSADQPLVRRVHPHLRPARPQGQEGRACVSRAVVLDDRGIRPGRYAARPAHLWRRHPLLAEGNPLQPVRRTGAPALRSAGGHAHAIPHRYPAADLLRAAGLAPTVRTGTPGHHGYGPRSDAPWPAPTEISAKGGVGWITPKAYPRVFVRRAEIRDPRSEIQNASRKRRVENASRFSTLRQPTNPLRRNDP